MESQTDPRFEELRAEVVRLSGAGPTPELRAAAVAYYRLRAEQGATLRVAGAELGLNHWTLAKWWQKRAEEPGDEPAVDLESEGGQLREEIDGVGPRSPSRRYPEELRRRIITWAKRQRARGVRARRISETLGIPWESLSRWTGERAPAKRGRLRAVTVVAERGGRAGLVLRASSFLVEGLDLDSLAELLRKLA